MKKFSQLSTAAKMNAVNSNRTMLVPEEWNTAILYNWKTKLENLGFINCKENINIKNLELFEKGFLNTPSRANIQKLIYDSSYKRLL